MRLEENKKAFGDIKWNKVYLIRNRGEVSPY